MVYEHNKIPNPTNMERSRLKIDDPERRPLSDLRENEATIAHTIYTGETSVGNDGFLLGGADFLKTEISRAHKPNSHIQGLRAVATVEIAKGMAAVLFGIWIMSFRNKDFGDIVANFLDLLHVDPAHEYAIKLVSMADKITPEKVVITAVVAILYALIRFTEGYGLWNARTWAEWFAIISGAAYLPWELWEFIRHPNWFHALLIIINIIVVAYIAYIRVEVHREHRHAPPINAD